MASLRIAVVGFGRMGHEVAAIAAHRGHRVVARIDPVAADADRDACTNTALADADVAIEFSLPSGVRENLAQYTAGRCPAVIGTTGWDAQRPELLRSAAAAGASLIYGSNFSVGANLFFRAVGAAAALANLVEDYDLFVTEAHHAQKKDSPSGTALTLAQIILDRVERKTVVVDETLRRGIAPHELHVASVRGGAVAGTHTVTLDSAADTIELTHRARNRGGFALGAVLAAEWLVDHPGVWSVDQFFDALFGAQ